MSTKALKTQLLAAVAMVLVASVALGSSTYAWFAANNTVKAENMSVSAKSDATFLEIRADGGEFTGSTLAVNAKKPGTDTKLLPCKPVFTEETLSKWQYAYSNVVDKYKGDAQDLDYKDIENTEEELSKYVLLNKFYLRTTVDGTSIENIAATEVTAATNTVAKPIDEAVRVLIVGANGYQIWDAGTKSFTKDGTSVGTVGYAASNAEGQEVKVYVYYDGDDEKLYTDNLDSLAGLTVSVTFAPKSGSTT